MKAYKYNEEKTLTWLEGRVKTLAKLLKEKNIHVTSGAISATFVASNIKNDQIEEGICYLCILCLVNNFDNGKQE